MLQNFGKSKKVFASFLIYSLNYFCKFCTVGGGESGGYKMCFDISLKSRGIGENMFAALCTANFKLDASIFARNLRNFASEF